MTHSREHLTTWIGLAVGLGLAWAGWEWYRNELPEAARMLGAYRRIGSDRAVWLLEWWAQPAIITALVIVVLLCTVAGAMVGRRGTAARP